MWDELNRDLVSLEQIHLTDSSGEVDTPPHAHSTLTLALEDVSPGFVTGIVAAVAVSAAIIWRVVKWFKERGSKKCAEAEDILSSTGELGEAISTANRTNLDGEVKRLVERHFQNAYFRHSDRGTKEMEKFRQAHEKGSEDLPPILLTELSSLQGFLLRYTKEDSGKAFIDNLLKGQHYLTAMALEETIASTQDLKALVDKGQTLIDEEEKIKAISSTWSMLGHRNVPEITLAEYVGKGWINVSYHIVDVIEHFKPLQTIFKEDVRSKMADKLEKAARLMDNIRLAISKKEALVIGGRSFEHDDDKKLLMEYFKGPIKYISEYMKLYDFAAMAIEQLHKLSIQYLLDFAAGIKILSKDPKLESYVEDLKKLETDIEKATKVCENISRTTAIESYAFDDVDVDHFPKGEITIGLEGLMSGIWDMIAKIFDKIGKMIDKLIAWLKSISGMGSSNSNFYTPETGKKINAIMNDSELKHAIADGLKEASKATTLGTEDFFSAPIEQTLEVFTGYQKSLSDKEVDFLTSGHRYKTIEKAVDSYTRARLPEYVMGIEYDLFTWGQEGLNKSLHTGNGEIAVENFVKEQKAKLTELERKYEHSTKFIRAMSDEFAGIANENAARDRLNVFLKSPSGLFPHLEHLWKVIHFDRISEEDSKLINTLEDIHKKHETMLHRFRAQAKENDKFWPAEDEMLKMIMTAHKESSANLSKVVKVAGYIKESALTAFNATMKSFSYLIRILSIVSKMGNVDQVKVKRSVEIISQRRRDLNSLLKIV